MPDETPVSEPGPNFSTFSGGASAAGGIIGTNHLQTAIDKLSQAVDKFQKTVDELKTVSGGRGGAQGGLPQVNGLGSNWNTNGFTTFAQSAPQGPSSPYMPNAYHTAASSPYSGRGPSSPYPNMGGTLGSTCTSTSPGGGYGGMGTTGNGGFPGLGPQPGMPPPGGDVWAKATSGGGGGGGMTFAQMGATVAAAGAYMGRLGSAAMPTQLALNTAQQQMQLYSPMNSNTSSVQSQLQYGLGGTQGTFLGGGRRYPMWAQNGPDQMSAYAAIGATTGSFPSVNGGYQSGTLAQGLYQGMASTSYLNPAMSGTQSEQLMQSMYSPAMSMRAQMLGYQNSPLTMGRPGARNLSQVTTGMFERWNMGRGGGNNNISPGTLQAELGPNGQFNTNMQALGYNQSQIAQLTPDMEAYWRLYKGANGQKSLGTSAAQSLMNGLGSTNVNVQNSTKSRLAGYGINTSDLTNLKQMAGSQTAMQADQSQGFTAGVHEFTQSVQMFDHAVQALVNQVGAQGAEGFGKGFLGAGHSFGGPGWSAASGLGGFLLGKGMLGKLLGGSGGGSILGKLLGGGGGAGGGDALGAAGGAAGGAGFGAAAGGAATGIGSAGLLESIANMLGSPLHNAAQKTVFKGTGNPPGSGIISDIINAPMNLAKGTWSAISGLFGGGAAGLSMSQFQTSIQGKNATGPATMSSPSKLSQQAVKAANTQEGVPYVWGAEIPNKGFDCSGLVQWAYKQAGFYLPRTANDQYNFLKQDFVDLKAVNTGDVVFGQGVGPNMHEALMVSHNQIIEAPGTGKNVKRRPYNPAEWHFAARPGKPSRNTRQPLGQTGNSRNPVGGGASGYVNPVPSGATPERIDQGVDFGGSGPLRAIGNGVILETNGGGWPGGPFMSYRLTSGPDSGQVVYYAENITPTVHAGQSVSAGQTIAMMHGGIEIGWATSNGASTLSSTAAAGGITGANLPGGGANPTAVGLNFDQLLVSLGAPKAPNFGNPVGGKLPPGMGKGGVPGGSTPGTGTGTGNLSGVATPATLSGSAPGGFAGSLGQGDNPQEGSTPESAAFQSAISGMGASTTNGITSTSNANMNGGSIGNISVTGPAANSSQPSGNFPAASGGLIPQNAQAIANFLGGKGLNKVAIAGILGNIEQESGGNPNAGSNPPGRGLIQIQGDPGGSLSQDLARTIAYINANGGIGPINAAKTATQAATIFCNQYERPGIPDLQNRINSANECFAKGFAVGGIASPGQLALVGERGPELVRFGQAAEIMDNTTSTRLMDMAQGPHRAGFAQQYVTSNYHPAYNGLPGNNLSGGGNSTNLVFKENSINISLPAGVGAQGMPTAQTARTLASQMVDQLSRMNLHDTISSGVNS